VALETFDAQGRLRRVDDLRPELAVALADALQEGVIDSGGGVNRIDNSTLQVPPGTAWIDGDGVGGLNGRYRVTWPLTTLAPPPASGANFRGHRIVVPVPSGGHGVSAPVLLSGIDNGGVNLDSFNTADYATRDTPAGPAGALQLAVAISDSGGVPSTGVRRRRRSARGLDYEHVDSSGSISAVSDAQTTVLNTLGIQRFELSGAPVDFEFDFDVSCSASGSVGGAFTLFLNGSALVGVGGNLEQPGIYLPSNTPVNRRSVRWRIAAPAPGSYYARIDIVTGLGASNLTFFGSVPQPRILRVREILLPSFAA
jgi:hypothetical protein